MGKRKKEEDKEKVGKSKKEEKKKDKEEEEKKGKENRKEQKEEKDKREKNKNKKQQQQQQKKENLDPGGGAAGCRTPNLCSTPTRLLPPPLRFCLAAYLPIWNSPLFSELGAGQEEAAVCGRHHGWKALGDGRCSGLWAEPLCQVSAWSSFSKCCSFPSRQELNSTVLSIQLYYLYA